MYRLKHFRKINVLKGTQDVLDPGKKICCNNSVGEDGR